MSRKFIAAVLAASVVVTGFTSAPVRAADAQDVAKVLGGAALVYMIGKAVSEARAEDREKDKKEAKQQAWFHDPDPAPYLPRPYSFQPASDSRHELFAHSSQAQTRGVLPGACLRDVRGERGQVLLRSCLRSAAVNTKALPDRCAKNMRLGKDKEHVFSAQCLEKAGWRIARGGKGHGHDGHDERHDGRHGDWRYDWKHNGRRD
ncbi:hypothetical protein PVT71_18020 [Salipiger sp. H15]|uniref:Uncharacterized protein n=1 Tax=Alloyangia sp. H15 TaxID=3029062 RepID=A0AAU8AQA6_9RHOB